MPRLKKTNKKTKSDVSIENSFKKIDAILDKLENDDCSLNDCIKYYKEGIDYLNQARNSLDNIKKELEILDE